MRDSFAALVCGRSVAAVARTATLLCSETEHQSAPRPGVGSLRVPLISHAFTSR